MFNILFTMPNIELYILKDYVYFSRIALKLLFFLFQSYPFDTDRYN